MEDTDLTMRERVAELLAMLEDSGIEVPKEAADYLLGEQHDRLLTVNEAAKMCNRSVAKVRKDIFLRRLEVVNIGRLH